jgi:hypothetical protein
MSEHPTARTGQADQTEDGCNCKPATTEQGAADHPNGDFQAADTPDKHGGDAIAGEGLLAIRAGFV